MNYHSNINSSFVSCDFIRRNKSDGKNYINNKICKIKKNVGSFGKSILKSKKGTDFKIKQILKSQERSKGNSFPQCCPKSPPGNSGVKIISSDLCDQLHDIAAENLNLLSLSQTAMGAQSDPNNEAETFATDCFKATKRNYSLQAHNERTVTYCNSRHIASTERETNGYLHEKKELKANIELQDDKTVHKINAKGDNKSDKLNIGVENDAAQGSDSVQSFGNIIAKYGPSDGGSNIFLATKIKKIISIKTDAEATEAANERQITETKHTVSLIIDEDVLSGNELVKVGKEIRLSNYNKGNNERETFQCNSDDPKMGDVRSDHNYMRQLSETQQNNDHNNNDNNDLHNTTFDENDESLFIQIDQSKIKAIKNEILSSFRMSEATCDEKDSEKVPEYENKKKRKLDCDHYDQETKKIKLKDKLQNKRKKVRKHKNTAKVFCKRNVANYCVGVFTEIENFEKMDTDDVTEILNKKLNKNGFKEEENANNYNESLINERCIDSEIMDICEENEIMINEENSLQSEEATEEMDSEAKQNAFDELSDATEGASDDQMGTSDADSRIPFTRNWDSSEYYDTEAAKWRMETDESLSEKLESKMEEANESLYDDAPKEEFINISEDRKTRLRPRNYRSFLLTKEKRSRAFLKQRSRILGRWFVNHFSHPYPTKLEKDQLARDSNMPRNQVSEWFGNMRRRIREATRGQHLTWEEKVKRYNNLISGKSEPLPILPGDLINSHVDEGIENAKPVDESFSSEGLSPKFKRNLLQRYMNDYEIKSLPHRMNMTEEPDSRMSAIPDVSTNVFEGKKIPRSSFGKEESPKVENFYLFPIWREIRIDTEKEVEYIRASESRPISERNGILEGNKSDCQSTANRPCINKQSQAAARKRRSRNSQAFNHAGNLERMWTQLPNNSRVFVLDQKDSGNTTSKISQELQLDEDSNERPCSFSKRTKTNSQSSFLESEGTKGKKTLRDNPRSSDEIDAAYSLMELQKIL